MSSTLILSTDGNKVTLRMGFNDVPKHHISIKRKTITKKYPKQVRDEINLRIDIKKLQKRLTQIENQRKLYKHFEQLYVMLHIVDLLEILLNIQKHEE